MTMQYRILWAFFLQPVALGAWIPRIPEIQTKLELNPAGLALALAGAPVGTLLTLLFAGRLVNAIGARNAILAFYPAFLFAMALPLVAPSMLLLAMALALMAASTTVLELALNLSADEVERRDNRILMNKAHGFWSFGFMTGTALGALAASFHIAPILAHIGIALAILPTALAISRGLPTEVRAPDTAPGKITLPHPILLGICLYVFGTSVTEGAAADWSAIYMRDVFGSGPGASGIAVTAFLLSVALTRIAGDQLKQRFGPVLLGRSLALVGLAGVLIIVFAASEIAAVTGFVLLGIGASVAFPLGVTASLGAPGRNAASNVATLTFIALSGFLVGPLLIGSITQMAGIRAGLGVLFPMLLLSALLAPMLVRTHKS